MSFFCINNGMTDINEFAKQVEADLVAVNPDWAEYPFGTEQGILDQYSQTFDGVGTIFYYVPSTHPITGEVFRNTVLLEQAQLDSPDAGDGIDVIEPPTPPEASDLVYYGEEPPETPALSPIWFDTITGDIRIWYSYNGVESWVNTGVAGVGKIEFLNDLQDVDTLSLPAVDEDHLQFNLGMNKWIPFDLHGHLASTYSDINHTHAVGDLSDVTIDTPTNGQVLIYENGVWKNDTFDSIGVWTGTLPPTDTSKYPIWFNSQTGFTSIYYNDGNSAQWVDIGGTDARVTTSGLPHSALAKIPVSYTVNANNQWVKLDFQIGGTGSYDTNLNFNDSTNEFTIPVDGIYSFSSHCRFDGMSHSSYSYLSLYKNGAQHQSVIEGQAESTNYQEQGFTVQLYCEVGDTYDIRFFDNSDSSILVHNQSWFSINLEHEM